MKKQLFFALAVVLLFLSVLAGVNALTYSSLANNATAATKYHDTVNWSVSILDNSTTVNYVFATNASGSWVSDSSQTVTLTDYRASMSVVKTVGVGRGKDVCGNFTLTNATDTVRTSNSCFVVGNTAPAWAASVPVPAVNEDSGTSQFNLSSYATDIDADALTFSIVDENASRVDCDIVSGTNLSYTPAADWNGAASCTVRASDGSGNADKAVSISIVSVVDGPRLAVDQNLSLGGSAQKRSNPDNDEEVYVTGTITVRNTGDMQLTGLAAAHNIASKFNVTVTLAKTILLAGESTTATVRAEVPEDLDAVDSNYRAAAQAIGAITFTASPSLAASTAVAMQAENNLEVTGKISVKYDTKSESVTDGDTVKDLKPGQTVTMKLTAKNKFSKSDEVRIESISFQVQSDDLDADEEGDISRLDPTDTDSGEISFKVDANQDDGTYDVVVILSGTDEYGAEHGKRWVIKMKVVRETHEIAISEVILNPSEISCERNVQLSVTLKNIGLKDEDKVFINIAAPGLKFGKVLGDLIIDQDESLTKVFDISIPDDVKPGSYRIDLNTYYDSDQLSDSAAVYLVVNACGTVTAPPQNQTVVIVPQPTQNVTAQPPAKPFTEQPLYFALLIALNVFVLVIALGLVARLFRK